MDKKTNRIRRARRTRAKISELNVHRLSIHRTARHIYAQIISPEGDKVIAVASTLQKPIKKEIAYTGNIAAATTVGKAIAALSKGEGINKVAFDRSGFKYHGRVKALAEAAREAGLEF